MKQLKIDQLEVGKFYQYNGSPSYGLYTDKKLRNYMTVLKTKEIFLVIEPPSISWGIIIKVISKKFIGYMGYGDTLGCEEEFVEIK